MSIDSQLSSIKAYCNFEDPSAVYILIMLPRKKENKDNTERDKLNKRTRFVVQNLDDVKYALDEFERQSGMYPEIVFRIYVSVNRRSLMKGMIHFQKKLLDFNKDLMNGNNEIWTPIARLGSEFKSVLAKSESKHDKFWLFDIDLPNDKQESIDAVKAFEKSLDSMTEVVYSGLTKSGFVIIIKPCNPHDIVMPADTEMKKDAYLYIDVLNVK